MSQNIRGATMSDTNSLDMVREYLTRKNETELRQALVKMEGGLVRWVVSSISTRCTGEILHVRVKE